MSKYPEKCHVNGCPCGYFSSKPPSEPPTTGKGDTGFLIPEAENVSERQYGAGIGIPANGHVLYVTGKDCQPFHVELGCYRQCPVCEGGLAVCRLCNEYEAGLDEPCRKAQSIAISVPTFNQEWQDAPRWTTRYTELDRLRAVLFGVIDAGCNCGIQAGETGKHAPWVFDDDDEDFANEQRTQFVDEVIRRLQPSTQVAEYWFIRGQHAKEVELAATMNIDMKEMVRAARERMGR